MIQNNRILLLLWHLLLLYRDTQMNFEIHSIHWINSRSISENRTSTCYLAFLYSIHWFLSKNLFHLNSIFLISLCTILSTCMCAQSLSGVWPFVIPRTVTQQATLSMEFNRREYWSGLPFPIPGDLPNLGIESASVPFYLTYLIIEET